MKKLELERMLMDTEGLKKLTERANDIKQKEGELGRTEGRPASKLQVVKPSDYDFRPTPDEIKANDFDYVERKPLLANISHFLPDLEKEDPKKVLSILTEQCRKDPSDNNQFLVEDAINRLTSSAHQLDVEAERLISESIEMLSVEKPEEKKEQRKDSIWSRLYQHSDYRGRSLFVNHGPGWVYRLFRVSSLNAENLNDRISSLYVDASATEVRGEVVLFEHDRFLGRYARFTTTPGAPTVRNYISYVGNFINDRTSSILVVRRFNNELTPIALGDLGLRDEIATFASSVPRISLRGDPIVTWDMWPSFDSRRFVYIRIPVRVDVPHWFDYDAEIRYWIYLYVSSTGTLRGYVAWYGAWVEGGVKTGSILDRIMDALPDTLGDINSRLRDALEMASAFGPFERQYFLPGTAISTGHTNDDVSLVLVRA